MWKLVKRGTWGPVLATSKTLAGIEAERHQLVEMLNGAFPGFVKADDFEAIQSRKPTLDDQRSTVLRIMHETALAMDSGDQGAVRGKKEELYSALARYRDLGAGDEDIGNLCSGYIDRYGWRR